MPKKIVLTIGLLMVLPILAVVLFPPGSPGGIRRAAALEPQSSFSTPVDISYPTDPQTNASQRVQAVRAPDGYFHAIWMEGLLNTATGPAYNKGQGTSWPQWEWAGPHNNPGYVIPSIALDSHGTVHVVWGGGGGAPYDIYYAYKTAGGGWSTPENISNESYNTVKPSLAIDKQDRLWVAWQSSVADNDDEIFVRSKPYGGSWEAITRITTWGPTNQDPSLVVDSNNIPHLAWRSTQPGNWEIIYTRYVGGSWTPFENISATPAPNQGSHFPKLAANNAGDVFAAWEEETGSDQFQTAVRRWNNGSWGARTFGSAAGNKALYPDIAVDDVGTVYVAWTDYRTTPTDIFFNHSRDYGVNWATDEDVWPNEKSSFYPCVVAEAGGYAHIFWQDANPGSTDIFYSKATIPGVITPIPVTPTPTNTPPPVPPYGGLDIVALQPPGNKSFTRQAAVKLDLWAVSPVGNDILMRYDNYPDFQTHPEYEPFAATVPSWTLLVTAQTCSVEPVYAQFKNALDSGESPVYYDAILYDDYLLADMVLNGGNAYTNREMVEIGSSDLDLANGCSGLYAMQFREEGITYTTWYSYFPRLQFYLQPTGAGTRTVYGHYLDGAGNEGSFSDQIAMDLKPPHDGTAPTLPASTSDLVISVSNLQATDDESGMGYVWLANNCSSQGEGSWAAFAYCPSPPCAYDWNLGYGGPPILAPDLHTVCVKYEDRSGYQEFRGNFSQVYMGTITVNGIRSAFLPLVTRGNKGLLAPRPLATPATAGLSLLADPSQAGPGQDVLLYLFAPPQATAGQEGTLRIQLPVGLRVVRAWSAYGELLEVGPYQVRSHEQLSAAPGAWLTVLARVEPGADLLLPVQGELVWDAGTLTSAPVWVENLEGR